jgi:DNA/RNA endonuclease YhcR with UshA esterase domain
MTRRQFVLLMALSATTIGCAGTRPAGPVLINASDKAAVQAAMPTVTVAGVVSTVTSTDEVVTINFQDTTDSRFYAVVLNNGRAAVEKAFDGDIAKAITGKTVHVTGVVTLYRGRPEIVISKPEQLTIVP